MTTYSNLPRPQDFNEGGREEPSIVSLENFFNSLSIGGGFKKTKYGVNLSKRFGGVRFWDSTDKCSGDCEGSSDSASAVVVTTLEAFVMGGTAGEPKDPAQTAAIADAQGQIPTAKNDARAKATEDYCTQGMSADCECYGKYTIDGPHFDRAVSISVKLVCKPKPGEEDYDEELRSGVGYCHYEQCAPEDPGAEAGVTYKVWFRVTFKGSCQF